MLGVVALIVATTAAHAQVTVTGTVFDSLVTQRYLGDATVMIVELNRTSPTDRRGRFQFDSVPSGVYHLTFFHEILDSLELAAPQTALTVTGSGRVAIQLATPSPATAYARLCPGRRDPGTGVAYGRVRDADDGHAIGGAALSADWVEWLLGGGRPTTRQRMVLAARSSANGAYVLCGLPLDVAIEVRAEAFAHEAGPVPMQPGASLLARRDFALSVRDPATRAVPRDSVPGAMADSSAPPGTASLSGVVRTPDGKAFAGATLGVLGSLATGRSGDDGRFLMRGVPAGTHAIQVRAIGFTPLVVVVDVATGARFDTTVVLDKRPQALAPVAITGLSDRNDRNGFNDRRKKGFGSFITREDIERWGPIDLVDLTTLKPSVRRVWSRRGGAIEMRGSFKGHCTPNVFLDGMEVSTGGAGLSDVDGLVRPAEVIGVEIYTGPMIPMQFDRSGVNGCGSIVMWTR